MDQENKIRLDGPPLTIEEWDDFFRWLDEEAAAEAKARAKEKAKNKAENKK